jgi:L-seryl-tRNA(Ser) seleniumtransferase
LSNPALAKAALPAKPASSPSAAPTTVADLSGTWEVDIDYIGSQSRHTFSLKQAGSDLSGKHQGDFVGRDVSGSIDGQGVRLQSRIRGGGIDVGYGFTGQLDGNDRMGGELDLGEYLTARWTARRATGKV